MVDAQRAGLPVVVAGGGIGGLATAIGLSRAGYRVTVLEKAQEFGEIGAGIQLGPNAFHALKTLGVADKALANAVYIDRLIMMDAMTGDQVCAIPVDAPFREHFKNPYAVIHRADLHSPLLDVCRTDPNVALLAKHEVTAFVQSDGIVEVATAEGPSFKGLALIGADGVRSKIRQAIVGDGAPRLTGHVAYRAVLPIEEMPEELRWNAACLWAGPKCHMVHYPLRGWKLFNIVATFDARRMTEGHNEPGDRDELLAHFEHLPAKPRSVLEKSRNWRRWVLGDRDPVDNWSDGNVTLLGDAAHATLQYFAQGACMALEDAVCLTSEVREAKGGGFPEAFRRYQDKRITRTARIVLSSRELGRIYHAAGVERLVRNDMFSTKSPRDFYRSLDWLYGYGRDA